jgi:Tfp pilus assembly protein PilE
MTRRRGSTLMEVIALMIGVAVMLTLSITSIQALVTIERSNRKEADTARKIDRLAETFRRDVHRAKGWNIAANEGQSTLTVDLGAGHTAIYTTTPQGVDVTHQPAGKPPTRKERFLLPDHRVAMAEVPAEASAPARPRLTITRSAERDDARALRIEPIPGREVSR